MKADRIRGKTIYWTFSDGPMAKRSFEHVFLKGGALKFRAIEGAAKAKMTRAKKYDVARVNADVYAVSYLGPSGFTLTVVLDFRTHRLVAFASNEKSVVLQQGTFEVA
jgi:hypothetical protein